MNSETYNGKKIVCIFELEFNNFELTIFSV